MSSYFETRPPPIEAFLAAAEDHLSLLEEHIRDAPGYEWPMDMARLDGCSPADAKRVIAWLRTRLTVGEWGR